VRSERAAARPSEYLRGPMQREERAQRLRAELRDERRQLLDALHGLEQSRDTLEHLANLQADVAERVLPVVPQQRQCITHARDASLRQCLKRRAVERSRQCSGVQLQCLAHNRRARKRASKRERDRAQTQLARAPR
jgi:hypothetical protein